MQLKQLSIGLSGKLWNWRLNLLLKKGRSTRNVRKYRRLVLFWKYWESERTHYLEYLQKWGYFKT